MSEPAGGEKVVAVLDIYSEGQRRIAESVQAAGMSVREVSSLDHLVQYLGNGPARVCMIAYEVLWPEPQKQLRWLRDHVPGARIAVVYSEKSPRKRLAERLWAIGLFDHWVPRAAPPHELAPTLRQAFADALIEEAVQKDAGVDPESLKRFERARFYASMAASFTNQTRVEGLLRELQMKLPRVLDYHVLHVMVVDPDSGRGTVHVFQTRPLDHEFVWALAEEMCATVAPFATRPLTPNDIEFVQTIPVPPNAPQPEVEPSLDAAMALPLVLWGELVGAIGLLLARPARVTYEDRTSLRVMSYQLATSLRYVTTRDAVSTAAETDELTGVHNRRFLDRALRSEWRRAERYEATLSLALVDIDHFRKLNVEHGHVAGDVALRALATTLREHLRQSDYVVRYAGEQFVLLLPETGPGEAVIVLERLRNIIATRPFDLGGGIEPVTLKFSAGVAGIPACGAPSPEGLLEMAGAALTAAKRTGRNRICMARGRGFDGVVGQIGGSGEERRRFPRIESKLAVRYLPLPTLDNRLIDTFSQDVSAEGIALRGPSASLVEDSYVLVFLDNAQRPELTRVVWSRAESASESHAGLRFVRSRDLGSFHAPPQQPRATPHNALVIANAPTRRLIARVLHAARYRVRFAEDHEAPAALADLANCSAVVVGASALRGKVRDRLRALRQAHDHPRLVVVNEGDGRKQAVEALCHEQVPHMIGDLGSDEALFATVAKLVSDDLFGIEKYLRWGTDSSIWTLSALAERADTIEQLRHVTTDVGCDPRIAEQLLSAVDEMLVNAITHASGASNGDGTVTVQCGCDGRLLAVGVLDRRGALTTEALFASLARAEQQIRQGSTGGANVGVGFHSMLSRLSQLAVNVEPGRRTEVVGIVDLRRTLHDHQLAAPSFGLFTMRG